MADAQLDIGPLAGELLLGSLLRAIGSCGPEGARVTLITNGGRPLAVLAPPSGAQADEGLTALDWEEIFTAGARTLIGSGELRRYDMAQALEAMARKARQVARR